MMKVCRRPQAPGHRPPPLPWSAQQPTSAERRRCQGGTPSTDQDKLDRRWCRRAKLQQSRYEDKVALPTVFVRFESGTMARRRRNPPQSRQSVKVWLISHTPTRGRALSRPETPQTLPSPRRQATLGAVAHTATRFALPPALSGSGAIAGPACGCGSAHGGVRASTIRAASAARGAVRWSAHCRQRECARLPVTWVRTPPPYGRHWRE